MLTVDELLWAFERMSEIREFETRVEKLFYSGAVRGSTHLAIGQEAVAAGARIGSEEGDLVAPTYRGHHFGLAWGIPLDSAFCEILGRDSGSNRGRGGSKHFSDRERGVIPANAIVAAALPIACGAALSAALDQRDQVTITPFGDGATNQAVFHEALNQAAVWDLPVIFLCENNLYSEMTPISRMVRIERLADRAAAYGIPGVTVDGMDVVAVAEAVAAARSRAASGSGPTLIEAMTYRFCGHMPGDNEPYRSRAEVDEWRKRDPLTIAREQLSGLGVEEDKLDQIVEHTLTRVRVAEEAAHAAEEPQPADLGLGTSPWMEVRR
jgi:TPP-dependent pyruvate/acetoin dehydrogenase alpha subunit